MNKRTHRYRWALVGVGIPLLVIAVYMAWSVYSPSVGTPLLNAAEQGNLDKVKTLIKEGAAINATCPTKFGWTPLHAAVFHHETNVIYYLVQAGADVNAADKTGTTPLMTAIGWGDEGVDVVEFLANHGANLEAEDKYGVSVFSYAYSSPAKPKVIEALEKAKQKHERGDNR